ncbi:serine hydrolase domain-containing protein [Thermobifida alba]|uniref:serine hydrolase domain-containing protein n=1 Tax=Thermobifida alba TaxID=53522 RepID=UPI0020C14E19|nr:serine hydrolase domain-containing protein [Thermobifida alba]
MELDRISGLLEKLAERHRVPGAQLAVYLDGELLEAVHGVTRTGRPDPVTPRSRFPYGSVSKIFTAALVMQLVEDGEIELDRPVADHLASHQIPHGHPMRSTTLRHLLSHTSGLVSDHEGAPLRSASLRRHFTSVLDTEWISTPGTAFSYSNTGYAVAAYVVEAVTGQDWWEAIESYLFGPTGLDLAFVHDARTPSARPDTVSGHAVHSATGHTEPVDFYVEPALTAAGGLAGSATDLVAFARAFMAADHAALDTEIADPEVLAEMGREVRAAEPFGLADGWCAGWGVFHADRTRWLGHDGTLDGGTCNVRLDPAGGAAVALTTNSTTGLAMWEDLVDELRNLGLHVGHYRQPRPASGTSLPDARFTGNYTNGELSVRITPDQAGAFRFNISNGLHGSLEAGPDLTFSVEAAEYGGLLLSGRFLRAPDSADTVELMQYNGRTLRRTDQATAA